MNVPLFFRIFFVSSLIFVVYAVTVALGFPGYDEPIHGYGGGYDIKKSHTEWYVGSQWPPGTTSKKICYQVRVCKELHIICIKPEREVSSMKIIRRMTSGTRDVLRLVEALRPYVKDSASDVMIWAVIKHRIPTPLVCIDGILNILGHIFQILKPEAVWHR
ncbi:hypothetical protein TNCV_3553821 [Trichonephila clavipes]|nr:hypothetical protein TNCV_3553821 [Trichonephila clavipes]